MQVKTTYHPATKDKPARIIASCRNPRRLLTISYPEALSEPHLYAVGSLVAQLICAGVLDAGVKVEQIGADKRGRFYVWGVD